MTDTVNTTDPENMPTPAPAAPARVLPLDINNSDTWPAKLDCHTEVMSRREAGASRKPGLRDRFGDVICIYDRMWVRHHYPHSSGGQFGVTVDPPHNWPRTDDLQMVQVDRFMTYSENCIIYLLTPEEIARRNALPKRRCKMESFISPSLCSMLSQAPLNETYRAMMMQVLGRMPPPEAATYVQLKDWVEFNFPIATTTAPEVWGQVRIEYVATEYGTCKYSNNKRFSGQFKLTSKMLKEAIHGASVFEDVLTEVTDEMKSYAQDNGEYQGEETDCHESNGDDEVSLDYSSTLLANIVRDYIKAHGSEEDKELLED